MDYYILVALIIIIIVQAADIISTYLCITAHKCKEGNWVMVWFMMKLGLLPGMIVPKIPVILLACILAWYIPGPELLYVLGFFAGYYANACYRNFLYSWQ